MATANGVFLRPPTGEPPDHLPLRRPGRRYVRSRDSSPLSVPPSVASDSGSSETANAPTGDGRGGASERSAAASASRASDRKVGTGAPKLSSEVGARPSGGARMLVRKRLMDEERLVDAESAAIIEQLIEDRRAMLASELLHGEECELVDELKRRWSQRETEMVRDKVAHDLGLGDETLIKSKKDVFKNTLNENDTHHDMVDDHEDEDEDGSCNRATNGSGELGCSEGSNALVVWDTESNDDEMISEMDIDRESCSTPSDWDTMSATAVVELEMLKESIEHFLVDNLERFGRFLSLESRHSGRDNGSLRDEVDKLVSVISSEIEYEEDDDGEAYVCPLTSDANELYDYWDISSGRLVWSPPNARVSSEEDTARSKVRETVDSSAPYKVPLQPPALGVIPEEDEDEEEDEIADEDTQSWVGEGIGKETSDSSSGVEARPSPATPIKGFAGTLASTVVAGALQKLSDETSPATGEEEESCAASPSTDTCAGDSSSSVTIYKRKTVLTPTLDALVLSAVEPAAENSVAQEESASLETTGSTASCAGDSSSSGSSVTIYERSNPVLEAPAPSAVEGAAGNDMAQENSLAYTESSVSKETVPILESVAAVELSDRQLSSESGDTGGSNSHVKMVVAEEDGHCISVLLSSDLENGSDGRPFISESSEKLETNSAPNLSLENFPTDTHQENMKALTAPLLTTDKRPSSLPMKRCALPPVEDSTEPLGLLPASDVDMQANSNTNGGDSHSSSGEVEHLRSATAEITSNTLEGEEQSTGAKRSEPITSNESQSAETPQLVDSQMPASQATGDSGSQEISSTESAPGSLQHGKYIANEIDRLLVEVVELRRGSRTTQPAFPAKGGDTSGRKKNGNTHNEDSTDCATDRPAAGEPLSDFPEPKTQVLNPACAKSSPGPIHIRKPDRKTVKFHDLQLGAEADNTSPAQTPSTFPSRLCCGSGLCGACPQCRADKEARVDVHSVADATRRRPCNSHAALNDQHLCPTRETRYGKTADGSRSDTKEQIIWVRLSDISLIAHDDAPSHSPVLTAREKPGNRRASTADSRKHSRGKKMNTNRQVSSEPAMTGGELDKKKLTDYQPAKKTPPPDQPTKRSAVIKGQTASSSKTQPLAPKYKLAVLKAKSSIGGSVLPSKLKHFSKSELLGTARAEKSSKELKGLDKGGVVPMPKAKVTASKDVREAAAKQEMSRVSRPSFGTAGIAEMHEVSQPRDPAVHQTTSHTQTDIPGLEKASSADKNTPSMNRKKSASASKTSDSNVRSKSITEAAKLSAANRGKVKISKKKQNSENKKLLPRRHTQPVPLPQEQIGGCGPEIDRGQGDDHKLPKPTETCSLPIIPLSGDGEGYDASAWIKAYRKQQREVAGSGPLTARPEHREKTVPHASEHVSLHNAVIATQSDVTCTRGQPFVTKPDTLSLPMLPTAGASGGSRACDRVTPTIGADGTSCQISRSASVAVSTRPPAGRAHEREGYSRAGGQAGHSLPSLLAQPLPGRLIGRDPRHEDLLGSTGSRFPKRPSRRMGELDRDHLPPLVPPETFSSLPALQLTREGEGYDAETWIRANRNRVRRITAANDDKTCLGSKFNPLTTTINTPKLPGCQYPLSDTVNATSRGCGNATELGSAHGSPHRPRKSRSEAASDQLPTPTWPDTFSSLPSIPRTSDGRGYNAEAWIRANRDRVRQITSRSKAESSRPMGSGDRGCEGRVRATSGHGKQIFTGGDMRMTQSDTSGGGLPQIRTTGNKSLPDILPYTC